VFAFVLAGRKAATEKTKTYSTLTVRMMLKISQTIIKNVFMPLFTQDFGAKAGYFDKWGKTGDEMGISYDVAKLMGVLCVLCLFLHELWLFTSGKGKSYGHSKQLFTKGR
jgi:hypothetical protein